MTANAQLPINQVLAQLSSEEKWQAFQFLWQEVAEGREDEIVPPAWHLDVLHEREARISLGEATWMPLEDAIKSLEAKYE